METDPPEIALAGPGTIAGNGRNGYAGSSQLSSLCGGGGGGKPGVPWLQIVSTPAFIAIALCHFAYAGGSYVLLAWLPTYFSQALEIDEKNLSLTAAPYVAQLLMVIVGGTSADLLTRKGVPLLTVRKGMTCMAFVPPALFLWLCGCVTSPSGKVACLALSMSMSTLVTGACTPPPCRTQPAPATLVLAESLTSLSLSWSLSAAGFTGGAMSSHLDISSDLSGVLYGLTNTFATTGGIVGVSFSAQLLDRGYDWSAVFCSVAACYLVAAAVFLYFGDAQKKFN